MAVVETLLAAKAAVGVGKGVMNWLNAKNRQFKLTPEERRANRRASEQAALGMGEQGFSNVANQFRQTSSDQQQAVRGAAFSGGLENSAVTQAAQNKVNQMSNSQIADLALQIADRNAQFRREATERKTNIQMQIGERKRQFDEETRRMKEASVFQTINAVLDFGIEVGNQNAASQATKETMAMAQNNEAVGSTLEEAVSLVEARDIDAAMLKLDTIKDLEFDMSTFQGTLKLLMEMLKRGKDE